MQEGLDLNRVGNRWMSCGESPQISIRNPMEAVAKGALGSQGGVCHRAVISNGPDRRHEEA